MNCPRRHMCWQSKRFYWEREPGWRAVGWGNPGEQLCQVAHSLGFYSDGNSFWVVYSQSFWLRVLPGGACLVQPRWMLERRILGVVGHVVSHFDLSWTLPVGGGLLVPCSLPGPPVVKILMQMVTVVPGQGGRFPSVCFPWHFHRIKHKHPYFNLNIFFLITKSYRFNLRVRKDKRRKLKVWLKKQLATVPTHTFLFLLIYKRPTLCQVWHKSEWDHCSANPLLLGIS